MSTDDTTPSPAEAAEMLRAATATRTSVGRRAAAPAWYYPALGLLLAAMMAAAATHDDRLLTPAALLAAVGSGALVAVHRARAGLWVASGVRGGRARRLESGILAGLVVLGGVPALLDAAAGQRWPWLVAAVVTVPFCAVMGRAWEKAYREDLESGR
ncbi:hypothetical protein [Motilibacter aurantiacus]|uniref:hypothetical protein n=1 Tax=Motilibacter aurantiacus TaxID=2714955 RepID=UPI001407683A|nr:hypothetical protein [Motilibacter aurantiacus]NHC46598.1 hypothetical protein [Motilibacter aurantiacus]